MNENSKNNLKPGYFTKENAEQIAARRAEIREQRQQIIFNRSNVLKKIFSEPLDELTKYSKQFKKIIESKFDNIDNLTVFEAVQINAIMHYLTSNAPRIYKAIMDNAYGKLKDETERKTIEIPVMQDPIDLIKQLPPADLKILFESIKNKIEIQ